MTIDNIGEVVCPICGGTQLERIKKWKSEEYNETLFSCLKSKHDGLAFCKGCKKLYPYEGFGKHGDVYECKECGRVQWEFTELKKQADAAYAAAMNAIRSIKF